MTGRKPATAAPAYVAIACWLDLLGYGGAIDKAGFDPAHPLAQPPLRRLRAFHRIVSKHSSAGFPTLVMNDGAVAYSNVELVRSDKVWRFIERCWALYLDATATDRASGGPGLRGVIAVGLRAKGSNRGIVAQEKELAAIIKEFAAARIDEQKALVDASKVRRVFDIIPQLQANFAFTRAYEAETAGSDAGMPGPNLFLDTAVFTGDVPGWITAEPPIAWTPKKAALATSFVAIRDMETVSDDTAHTAFRTGRQLLVLLSHLDRSEPAPPADPCLYKYSSFETARIVLASGRLRWTTPPLLNDPYDLSFGLHMEIEPDVVRKQALDLLWGDYRDDSRPAPQELFELWKQTARAEYPKLTRKAFDALAGPIIDAAIARSSSTDEMNAELQRHLQRSKLLCLTETPANMLMWAHYGQQHQGAVLRFTREGDNNAFSVARPVAYARRMPRFADSTTLARSITGRLQDPKALSDSQIYTKALEWRYEREWRISFGLGRDHTMPYEDLPFGDELLTGVVMGCRMPDAHRAELALLARRLNSEVELFEAIPDAREFRMMIASWQPPPMATVAASPTDPQTTL